MKSSLSPLVSLYQCAERLDRPRQGRPANTVHCPAISGCSMDVNRSPSASARPRHSSAAARALIGSPPDGGSDCLTQRGFAQGLAIVGRPGQIGGLGKVDSGCLRGVAYDQHGACVERCGDQRGVVELPRDRQCALRWIQAAGGRRQPRREGALVRPPRAPRPAGATSGAGRVGDGGVEQRQSVAEASTRDPKRLQRRREPQRRLDVGVFATPRERRPQIVDLDVGPVDQPLDAATRMSEPRSAAVSV